MGLADICHTRMHHLTDTTYEIKIGYTGRQATVFGAKRSDEGRSDEGNKENQNRQTKKQIKAAPADPNLDPSSQHRQPCPSGLLWPLRADQKGATAERTTQ